MVVLPDIGRSGHFEPVHTLSCFVSIDKQEPAGIEINGESAGNKTFPYNKTPKRKNGTRSYKKRSLMQFSKKNNRGYEELYLI